MQCRVNLKNLIEESLFSFSNGLTFFSSLNLFYPDILFHELSISFPVLSVKLFLLYGLMFPVVWNNISSSSSDNFLPLGREVSIEHSC